MKCPICGHDHLEYVDFGWFCPNCGASYNTMNGEWDA